MCKKYLQKKNYINKEEKKNIEKLFLFVACLNRICSVPLLKLKIINIFLYFHLSAQAQFKQM